MKHLNFVALPFIILTIAAFLSPKAANSQASLIVSKQPGTHLSVSYNYHTEITEDFCGGYTFNYLQRMTIDDGKSELVPTQIVIRPGEYFLDLVYTCEGYYYYDVFNLPKEFRFELENSAMFVKADNDNKPTKICKLAQAQ